jgi:hypothetical protein
VKNVKNFLWYQKPIDYCIAKCLLHYQTVSDVCTAVERISEAGCRKMELVACPVLSDSFWKLIQIDRATVEQQIEDATNR